MSPHLGCAAFSMTQTRPPQVSNAPVEGQILDSIFTSPVCLIHFGFGAAAYFAFIVYLAIVVLNILVFSVFFN